MIKFKNLKISVILCFLIISTIINIPFTNSSLSAEENQNPKIFSFNSYIDIEYDSEPLNKNLEIDQSINVPLTIEYRTDVPEDFLRWLPWQIKNIILYGSMIGPNQQITLSIEKKPDWADKSDA